MLAALNFMVLFPYLPFLAHWVFVPLQNALAAINPVYILFTEINLYR